MKVVEVAVSPKGITTYSLCLLPSILANDSSNDDLSWKTIPSSLTSQIGYQSSVIGTDS